ncbi:hypothetical protein ACS0TY_013197 [Phlomoides rotata]
MDTTRYVVLEERSRRFYHHHPTFTITTVTQLYEVKRTLSPWKVSPNKASSYVRTQLRINMRGVTREYGETLFVLGALRHRTIVLLAIVTVNVLGVRDMNMKYVYVLTRWDRSAADSRVLRDVINRPHGLRVPKGRYTPPLCEL